MNKFLVKAQSILNSIRSTIGRLRSSISRIAGGGSITAPPTGLSKSMLASMSAATERAIKQGRPTGYIESAPSLGERVLGAKRAWAEIPVSAAGVSTPKTVGSATPSPRATKTVVPKTFVAPTRHAPSLADIQAGIRKAEAQISSIKRGVEELSRTQAPVPSRKRETAGITPPPPVSRVKSKVSATPAITGSAIRSYRAGGGATPNPKVVPTPPAVERVPLVKRVKATIPKSAILRELKRARGKKAGYVLLPEARPLEARPRKLRVAT